MLEPAWIGKIEPVSRPTIRVALNTGRDSNKRLVDLRHPQENPQAAIAEDLLKRPRELLLEHRTDLDAVTSISCSSAARASAPSRFSALTGW
jgi:hypothetical protein